MFNKIAVGVLIKLYSRKFLWECGNNKKLESSIYSMLHVLTSMTSKTSKIFFIIM